MKASVNLEFIVSVFVFLTTVSFITMTIINSIPSFRFISTSEMNNAKAYSISEILLFDEGYPNDHNAWSSSNIPQRIGLSTGKKYLISIGKINKLQDLCNNYNNIRNIFGTDVIIEIQNNDNILADTYTLKCPERRGSSTSEFLMNRFAVIDQDYNNIFSSGDKIARIKVGVYV